MKEKAREHPEIFSVETNLGKVECVPITGWKELVPFWSGICQAFLETLLENDFKPYTATLKRPKGFVASSSYWRLSLEDPEEFPLSEARFFIYKLKEKPYFTQAIKEFNKKIGSNWLIEKNIVILGGYVYSFYYTLKPVLKVVGKGRLAHIKPIVAKKS